MKPIQVIMPQFTRPKSWSDPASPPGDMESWEALRSMDPSTLRELGLVPWDSSGERQTWLFPGEWYQKIPHGFMVTKIDGSEVAFELGVTDDDIRFGALPYGISIRILRGETVE